MRIGRSNIDKIDYTLKESLPAMEYVETENDIGVTIDNKLTFNQHITEKINKDNAIMGVLRRTMEYVDSKTFKLLYMALVRPHLEYANQVWSPYLNKNIQNPLKLFNAEPLSKYPDFQTSHMKTD